MVVKIAVDAMGGDFAPRAAVEGAVSSYREDGTVVLLVGHRDLIGAELLRHGIDDQAIEIVHTDEVVAMNEPAITPIRKKRRASVRVCAELVRDGVAQAMVTAGNTGAAMASAMLVMKTLPGVDRPALAAVLPTSTGRRTVLLDVGANVSTKSHNLRQFAVMGHLLAHEVLAVESPRIGLMSVGEEEGKGTQLTREVFKVLEATGLNFVGNVEGSDVYSGELDVIVCDGFVGNVLLKTSESLAEMVGGMVRAAVAGSWRSRLGAFLAMPALETVRRRIDPEEYGAAPLLGVQGGCLIGHGSSSAHGIRNAIRRAVEFAQADVVGKIGGKVALMHEQEEIVLGRADGDLGAKGDEGGDQGVAEG
jgi:glycerol-3-phosphate acyltransferase PlsX